MPTNTIRDSHGRSADAEGGAAQLPLHLVGHRQNWSQKMERLGDLFCPVFLSILGY